MGKDFLGNAIENNCMACQIASRYYSPPGGGILFEDEYFFVHQDPYVALPGFFIISSKRHIFAIDELTFQEQTKLGRIIAIVENVIKQATSVTHITIVQEDLIEEGHLHIWVFPWHTFITEQFNIGLTNMRTVADHYKEDMEHIDETISVAQKARLLFAPFDSFSLDYHDMNLIGADFSSRSDLRNANFKGAVLKRCKFDGCDLSFANFDGADLYSASFIDSDLYSTSFKNADLTRTNFSNAHLYGIKIFGTDMTRTIFDSIVREEKEKDYPKAEDVYNTIKRAFSENGNKEASAKYYYRQCVAKRKQMKGITRFINWLFADLLIGYGERLSRCLLIGLLVILSFSILFFLKTGGGTLVNYIECLLNSFATFFGFNQVYVSEKYFTLGLIYSLEQFIGYFLIALALIGITRKIVRD